MKDIIVGDIHFGKAGNSIQHNEDLVKFFHTIGELAESAPYRLIVQGDVFEQRDTLNVLTINYALETFKYLATVFNEIILIKGNHDLYYRDSRDVSSLAILEPYVDLLVDYYHIDGDRMYVSWLVSGEEYDEIVNISREKGIRYMFGHFEFNGFALNDHHIMEHGQSHKALKHIGTVFSSHYHARQTQGNVRYVGSPFPFDMNDANDPDRGYTIFDSSTGEIESVIYNAVKVISVPYKEFMASDYQDTENTSIRVVIDQELDGKEFDAFSEKLKASGFRNTKTVNKVSKIKSAIENTADLSVENLSDVDSMVVQYLSTMKDVDGIDATLLKDLYHTAKENKEGK